MLLILLSKLSCWGSLRQEIATSEKANCDTQEANSRLHQQLQKLQVELETQLQELVENKKMCSTLELEIKELKVFRKKDAFL